MNGLCLVAGPTKTGIHFFGLALPGFAFEVACHYQYRPLRAWLKALPFYILRAQ
jgi:hypothetical protein